MSHWWTGPLIDIAPPGRASVPNWWTGISGALIEPVDLVRALDAASPETPAGTSRTTCAHVSDLAPLRLTGRVQRARQRRIEGNRPEQFGLAHSTAGRTGSACHNDEHCVSATPDHGHSAGTNPVTSTLATSPVDPHPNSDGLASGSRRNLRRSAVRGAVSKPAPETGSSGARATATKKSRLCTRKIDSIASPARREPSMWLRANSYAGRSRGKPVTYRDRYRTSASAMARLRGDHRSVTTTQTPCWNYARMAHRSG
jgi:hypothetical protein